MTVDRFVDVASRARTRILFLYGLAGQLSPDGLGLPLTEGFESGRFTPHLEAGSRLLPRIHLDATLGGAALGSGTSEGSGTSGSGEPPSSDGPIPAGSDTHGTDTERFPAFTRLRLLLVVTPRGDAVLVLDGELDGESSAETITGLLASSCFDRTTLTLEGQPILDWVAARLTCGTRLEFGRDVHQVVFPGGSLRRETLTAARPYQVPATVTELIYRGTMHADDGQRLGVRVPPALNHPGTTAVAHGRGVSVISGWDEAVENAFGIGALILICALGVLQRARHAAFDALSLNDRATLASTADARTLVSQLSAQLNELQLDLSFGVEAYVD
ncbi:MAG: hypothetical protein ACRDUA_05670, partial [Micromonosporaceae bacterium]